MAISKDKDIDQLFEAILQLESVDECYQFFKDLCTVREIRSMTQRYTVARLLTDNHVYNDIVAETGASTATISRVNRSLRDGDNGYALVFARLEGER